MTIQVEDALRQSCAASQWERIGIKYHSGICTPLSSLYTSKSCGIGEYLDLLPLIDWCASLRLDVIQLLPLNDSGFDPSPYNGLSSCALHPIYLSLHKLPRIENHSEIMGGMEELIRFNQHPRVSYTEVKKLKAFLLKRYIQMEKEDLRQYPAYEEFVTKHPWLKPYALFKTLKEIHNGKDWREWPEEHKPKNEESFNQLLHHFQKTVEMYCLVQFLCYLQMSEVRVYAENRGVLLKGDIPILISPDSADVWYRPDLFLLDYSAGAPPDMYSQEGQYWGFPLFNWEAMEKEDYQWWRHRLKYAEQFYHLYRVDHIVGLFRLFGIPRGQKPKEGKFIPEKQEEWMAQGEKVLRMLLASTTMLPIGEDLGVVPPEVRRCLATLGVCGTKVMRWERNWEGDRRYIPPQEYNPLSMTTVSTHDSDPLALWWQHDVEDAKEYAQEKGWNYTPFLRPEHQKAILRDSLHSSSLFHINLLLEYLALIPGLHCENLEDERINVPGSHTDRNWSYKYAEPIEELTVNIPLKELITSLLE